MVVCFHLHIDINARTLKTMIIFYFTVGEIIQQTCFPWELGAAQVSFGPAHLLTLWAPAAPGVGHREQATFTFGSDIQDHIEKDESADHEQEGLRVHEGELGGPVTVIEEPDDQGHQAGLHPVDEEGRQVSEVIGNLTT